MKFDIVYAGTSLAKPAFKHDFPFDPAYGYDYSRLLQIAPPAAPSDFEVFWKGLYANALDVSVSPRVGKKLGELPLHDIHEVSYTSVKGVYICGWLAVPKQGKPVRAVVMGHGYGGRAGVDETLSMGDAVYIFPCLRGQSLSSYHDLEKYDSVKHVVWGIESRETYIHGECVADLWCAASALIELYPEAGKRLGYRGGSFGGGMGGLMLPWDSRFKAGWLEVPSFSNHPLRVQQLCVGSGQSVREYWLRKPEVMEVLRYFDSATAATFIKIPMYILDALFDPAVPPFGQFSVYNAIPSPKKLCVVTAGHFPYPEEQKEWGYSQGIGNQFLEDIL